MHIEAIIYSRFQNTTIDRLKMMTKYIYNQLFNNVCICVAMHQDSLQCKVKCKVDYGQEPHVKNLKHQHLFGQLSTTSLKELKLPNGQLPVVVDNNQLWTMVSEVTDSIDCPLPSTLNRGVSPKRHLYGVNARDKIRV